MPAHGLFNRGVFTLTPTSSYQFDIKSAALALGVVAGSDVFITIANGVTMSGTMLSGTSWPADCNLTVTVEDGGIISGAGGNGGAGANGGENGHPGFAGGPGFLVQSRRQDFFRSKDPASLAAAAAAAAAVLQAMV